MTEDYYVHPSACLEDGAQVGAGSHIWHNAHVRIDAKLGEGCVVGKSSFVDHGVQLPKKDEEIYLFYIKLKDGKFGNITDHTVDKWIQAYPSLDVKEALSEMQERYEAKQYYTKKSWFFGVAGELAKKEKGK